MTLQKHKEERFLFVIYHLICFLGACTTSVMLSVLQLVYTNLYTYRNGKMLLSPFTFSRYLSRLICIIVILLALSRTISIHVNYGAPIKLYTHLYRFELDSGKDANIPVPGEVKICVGKEWYRFPSNFFLPNSRFKLEFIRSGFHGLLPQPYGAGDNATSIIPPNMNNMNQEELTRYVIESSCHYIIDLPFPGQLEPDYSNLPGWKVIASYPFLDASKSNSLYRAFWIPKLSQYHNVYNGYYLLQNTELIK